MQFPPIYQTIFDRHQQIQKWAEPARVPIKVVWTKQGKALAYVGDKKSDVDDLLCVASKLYGGREMCGTVIGFERNVFIKIHFEEFIGTTFDVLLTDADILLVC